MNEMMGTPDLAAALPAIAPDLALDQEKYRSDMAHFELTEAQERELLETLWSIMRLFVELGFSVDVGGRVLSEIFKSAAKGQSSEGKK